VWAHVLALCLAVLAWIAEKELGKKWVTLGVDLSRLIHNVRSILVGRRGDDRRRVSLLTHGKHTGSVHATRHERSFIHKDDLCIKTTQSL
jgi:hypothetical protein